VAGVAHEINNPNNSIMLNVPILSNFIETALPLMDEKHKREGDFKISKIPYSALRPEIPNLLQGTLESSSRIKNIVNDLKDYAKDSSESEFEPLNINAVINSSLALLKSLLKKLANEIECELDPELPSVTGSYQKLEQVIVNLIQNACESKDGKKVNLHIRSYNDPETQMVNVSVTDNGNGIPDTKLKHIHDPFFTTKRANGGTGLGLSVSMGILKELKGEMHVDSVEGQGSIFTIKIPRKGRSQ
jgi:signal transduction histidine kinase